MDSSFSVKKKERSDIENAFLPLSNVTSLNCMSDQKDKTQIYNVKNK